MPTLDVRRAGTSPTAIARHYDLSDDFFRSWLGPELVYSCALWRPGDPHDALALGQERKLDWFAERLQVAGGNVLDVGCGWGALLERFTRRHGAGSGVGLTLSPNQVSHARARGVPGVTYRLESWTDHRPDRPYDAITAIESTEHFASDALSSDDKVDVYRQFFTSAASWLRSGGRMGLQLICLDGVGERASRLGQTAVGDLMGRDVFPESMPASLAEMVLGWETQFRLVSFLDRTADYVRTFRSWALAYRSHRSAADSLVGPAVARRFDRYFAAGEVCFRLREHALYRVVLAKRPQPKRWAVTVRPSDVGAPSVRPAAGASAGAVRAHYDLSNDFYAAWLGPTMMYTSGLWDAADPPDLEPALDRKNDFFADRVGAGNGDCVLDVGCGWGGTLRRLVQNHGVATAVGLTLSRAQQEYALARSLQGMDVRLESWADHQPKQAYDAILSFGAFEHFARDGTTGPERIATYRSFFARCFDWLAPGGRLGLETIAHDDAPDTAAPRGRGPLGDAVLALYPESICPHLSEVVLGFEPWFEVEVLRCDAADFARTCRHWLVRLREAESEAIAATDARTVREFRRYLASSEWQFRDGTLTNCRLVLHRRTRIKA
ncbi:MAG: class I SAM-dependent methyltransferase [Blastococcus sp.]